MGAVKVKRVVMNTNVLVSALLFGGVPGKLVVLWKEGAIQPLASKDIIEEYLRVLSYPKFSLTVMEIDYLFTWEILPWFEVISVKTGAPFVPDDPSDDTFLWCALQGKAEAIISGDEHLLSLGSSPVPVLTVHKYLKELGKSQRGKGLYS